MIFTFILKYIVLGPLFRVLYRPYVEGAENLPKDGAAIIASNHLSFMDNLFIPMLVPRKITFLAKSEYFTTPGVKGFLMKFFFKNTGNVPIDRDNPDAAAAALNTGVRVLKQGKVLGIYPEGTRSPDGRLYRGKTGVARMALESGAPVIPVSLIGCEKIQPPGRRFPKLIGAPRVGLRVGEPLDFSRYADMKDNRFVERSITDEIMYEIMQLSGQEYVDVYAAKLKKAKGGAAIPPADRLPETRAS